MVYIKPQSIFSYFLFELKKRKLFLFVYTFRSDRIMLSSNKKFTVSIWKYFFFFENLINLFRLLLKEILVQGKTDWIIIMKIIFWIIFRKSTVLAHLAKSSLCDVIAEPIENWTNLKGHNILVNRNLEKKKDKISINCIYSGNAL